MRPRETTVYLLPAYDEYVIGYTDRGAYIDAEDAPKMMRGNGFFSIMAIDGRFAGTWRRDFKKNRVVIETDFFAPLNAEERAAFERAARRYANYLEMDLKD
jgi:hypothetical protein